MNVQQLEYLLALDKHRQFTSAAEECHVTQPTLSMMLQKMERELDAEIFERNTQPWKTTELGVKLINQARRALTEIEKMQEIVLNEKNELRGSLKIGIIPTLASYLIPEIITDFKTSYPDIKLTIFELETDVSIEHLHQGSIDMIIAATPLENPELYEIPVYYEGFMAYFSPLSTYKNARLNIPHFPQEDLWVLEQGHCLRDQVFNFCNKKLDFNQVFEAGSIDTLIRILEKNRGYTIIPEMHLAYLTTKQKKNVKEIHPKVTREVSIVIKKSFIREKVLNAVADSIKRVIPQHMLNKRLKKNAIRLR